MTRSLFKFVRLKLREQAQTRILRKQEHIFANTNYFCAITIGTTENDNTSVNFLFLHELSLNNFLIINFSKHSQKKKIHFQASFV